MLSPSCQAIVTVDGSGLKDGDYAGICALLGCYGWIGITKENGQYYVSMQAKKALDNTFVGISNESEGKEYARELLSDSKVTLKLRVDFTDQVDTANFIILKIMNG